MKFLTGLKAKLIRFISGLGKKTVTVILAVSLTAALGAAAYDYFANTRMRSATVILNYEEAKQGLNPDGSKFNIADIKSDDVLKNALAILGDDSLSVDSVKDRITIDAKMPISAIEKTRNAIASGSSYNYNPSEFEIYYSQKKKLGKNNAVDFLEALSEAYYEYFITTYSDKNVILEFDGADDFEGYDYYEIYKVLDNKIDSMINYLGSHYEESTTFRSSKTGYSFENLTTMLRNLRDMDLEKYRAYVIQYKISKNTVDFIGKQNYLISKSMLNYSNNMQASDIANSALAIYDAHITGIAFIPSIDEDNEYYMGRTKTGIDNLAIRSYDLGERANRLKKEIDERQYLINKFSSEVAYVGDVNAVAEKMIVDICVFLEKISTVAILTDDDYISQKTNDYITFSLPERNLYVAVVPFGITFVGSFVVLFAAFSGITFLRKLIKNKESEKARKIKEKEAKA